MAVARRSYRCLLYCAVYAILVGADQPAWPGSCQSSQTADNVLSGRDLSGKTIIVTGADGNIAGEVCMALAKAKASLILACRSTSKCEAVQKRIAAVVGSSDKLEVEQLDLSSRENIAAFANRTMTKHAHIDVLINSAGTYGDFMTHDKLVGAMEINLLGPALLSELLLPALRGGDGHATGRVVNVAAATYGTELPADTTVADLTKLCTAIDKKLNETGGYFATSKFLMTHHAIELAKRETAVAAFALNPGVAVLPPGIPDWLKKWVIHFPYPAWAKHLFPKDLQRYLAACSTNEVGMESCPQTFAQGAAVIVSAAAWEGIESYSGSWLDFKTTPLPPDAPQVYGPWKQEEPTCTPRPPPPMDASLRSAWYDEMLRLMGAKDAASCLMGAKDAACPSPSAEAQEIVA